MISTEIYDEQPQEEGVKKQSVKNQIETNFLKQRQVFLWGVVDDESAEDIVSKLLYLESVDPGKPITFFINSPGGMVTSGFSIMDTMNLISSPVSTVCMGLAASMGSILLSAGEKGKRFIYPHGEVMIHQPSIGALRGKASDLEIHARQILKSKKLAAELLAANCGQTVDQVMADFDRDYWMDANESIEYGIVDQVYSF
ncbi:ClpP family protease [Sunxiuqinia elliptica]|uniref:ATP-dependent Clp protease proteolytic subunit n=1 Tax=Sunxiuqinia elliptica TaxID=655355 RepID=A0A4R6GWC1_9BACT|nr:ATP-dependent Clp protease proteolytic subunit [Sunxiuqinia elliptica]TDN99809.1 ATP-dependent Clp protease proteolytic subunit ClpP [Sunxiuqinia elliptica]TDO57001.1 ATP-dependent Clp protease proteolytic subunit ClpP [Sunxiuqinia elliptica]